MSSEVDLKVEKKKPPGRLDADRGRAKLLLAMVGTSSKIIERPQR
jgi:hypothetical protein